MGWPLTGIFARKANIPVNTRVFAKTWSLDTGELITVQEDVPAVVES